MDNSPSNSSPNDNGAHDEGERHVFTETFVFAGTSGQSFLATMQNIMNRLVNGPQMGQQPGHPQPDQPQQQDGQVPPNPGDNAPDDSAPDSGHVPESSQASNLGHDGLDDHEPTSNFNAALPPSNHPSTHHATGEDVDAQPSRQATMIDAVDDDEMPGLESLPTTFSASDTGDEQPHSMPRPMRPLPRNGVRPSPQPQTQPPPQPHSHFHAHTPNGTIDLFTFTVAAGPGEILPQPQGNVHGFTFTGTTGQDVLAGFEAFFLGMPGMMEKEAEPDIERAKLLLRGMEVVPEGLVRRLERAGGVPGGHGTEESSAAGCAVCWGPLLDEIEPGEWETALHISKEKENAPDADADTDSAEKEKTEEQDEKKEEEDELRGRIVALPCAHVYHAECLMPWFSRQTTCPTCRLDIDPDSLTWTPRPSRVPPPPQQQQPAAPSDQPPPPDTQPPNAQQPPPPNPQPAMGNPTDTNPQDGNNGETVRLNQFFNSPPFFFLPPRQNNMPAFGPAPPAQPHQQQQQPQPQPQQQQQQHVLPPIVTAPWRFSANVNVRFPLPQLHPTPLNNAPPPPVVNTPNTHEPFWGPQPPLANSDVPPRPDSHDPPPPPAADANLPPPPPPPQNGGDPLRFMPMPMPMLFVHPGRGGAPGRTAQSGSAPAPRRKWTPPEPVGKTLRQRVEQKERELGLRCDDAVCGAAPTDEDPVHALDAARLHIHAAYDAQGHACDHAFHPACLVMSARVAGVAGTEGEGEVQLACPACRAEGSLRRVEWDEGVRASEAEMA